MDPIKLLRPARFALIALLALPVSLCLAQGKAPREAAPPAPSGNYTMSIEFPGGPFSKLVALLNTNKESQLSIIQSVGLDPVLPAFSVHEVRVDAVIAALGRLLEPQGYILNPISPNLAVLTRFERHTSQAFASFQLEGKITARAGQTVEDVIAAIQQGCEFANSNGKASTLRFKYHPATKLLFVAGTEQEVDVAHRVFGSLPNAAPTKEPPPSDKK